MQRELSKRRLTSRVSLHLATSFEAAWQHVLLPWFEKEGPRAFELHAPVAVVTPSRSQAYFLRSKLLGRGLSLLGVHFFVPAQLREYLQTASMPQVPLREHLRLLLSVAANQCASIFERDGNIDSLQIARAIAREPDELLRGIDDVAATGASFAEFESPVLAEIARRFETLLKCCGCALVAEADRVLLQSAAADRGQRFADLLIIGFDAAHWASWPMLRAAVLSAQKATVILRQPREQAAELDQVWISTWEEVFGAAQQLAPPDAEPHFAELLIMPETAGEIAERKKNPLSDVHFVMGRDSSEQAQAVVAMAIGFLSEPSCERLAILLPGPGALARLVASWCEKLRIPHSDGIAHSLRGPLDDEEWRAWLELQGRPRLGSLLRFLNHSPAAVAFFAPLSLGKIQDTLQHACCDVLIDAVDVLREYCRRRPDDEKCSAVVNGLRSIRFLPEHAPFGKFLEQTDSIFHELKWSERSAELARLARGWSENFSDAFPREYFLRWLGEIFTESSLSRDACGEHPYARVQLLRYGQAEAETWSHVIFAGLNEGVWPPREDESPFLPDEQIAALNKRNKQESERFGEGQQIAREGTTLCIGARERRALALRRLLNVIESTTHAIGVASERYAQSPREQAVNPSEFFARLFFSARGIALSQLEIDCLHDRTHAWLAQAGFLKPARTRDAKLEQTAVAYRARRAKAPFGEYEFAFRKGSPPARQITLSASDIGNLLQRPALVWIKVFLGLEAQELNGGSWSLATGLWVHRWLAVIGAPGGNRFVARPAGSAIVQSVTAAADAFCAEVSSILETCGRPQAPDWWRSGWRNARHVAERFARELKSAGDWPQLATEWELDSPHIIQFDGGEELRVRGRVDLMLAGKERTGEIWIIDYKTGEAKPLTGDLRKRLLAGEGVQICIYALALGRDFSDIYASLLTRDAILELQLALGEIVAHDPIWKEIARMQRTGIFGMLGEIRSDYAFTGTYPLATLAIDKNLLEEKWEQTHPAFAKSRDR
jgi:PD-(D/E)XK nuclease superfamily